MGEQHDLGNAGLPAQEIDPRFHVEGQLLEIDLRFVVFVPRVHAKQQEAATRQLGAGAMIEEVRGAMHHEDADVRRRTGVGLIQRALADALKCDELRIRLCPRRAESNAENNGKSECGALHGGSPAVVSIGLKATPVSKCLRSSTPKGFVSQPRFPVAPRLQRPAGGRSLWWVRGACHRAGPMAGSGRTRWLCPPYDC